MVLTASEWVIMHGCSVDVYKTNDRSKRNRRTGQADHALVVNGKTVEVVSQVGHRYFGTMVIMMLTPMRSTDAVL